MSKNVQSPTIPQPERPFVQQKASWLSARQKNTHNKLANAALVSLYRLDAYLRIFAATVFSNRSSSGGLVGEIYENSLEYPLWVHQAAWVPWLYDSSSEMREIHDFVVKSGHNKDLVGWSLFVRAFLRSLPSTTEDAQEKCGEDIATRMMRFPALLGYLWQRSDPDLVLKLQGCDDLKGISEHVRNLASVVVLFALDSPATDITLSSMLRISTKWSKSGIGCYDAHTFLEAVPTEGTVFSREFKSRLCQCAGKEEAVLRAVEHLVASCPGIGECTVCQAVSATAECEAQKDEARVVQDYVFNPVSGHSLIDHFPRRVHSPSPEGFALAGLVASFAPAAETNDFWDDLMELSWTSLLEACKNHSPETLEACEKVVRMGRRYSNGKEVLAASEEFLENCTSVMNPFLEGVEEIKRGMGREEAESGILSIGIAIAAKVRPIEQLSGELAAARLAKASRLERFLHAAAQSGKLDSRVEGLAVRRGRRLTRSLSGLRYPVWVHRAALSYEGLDGIDVEQGIGLTGKSLKQTNEDREFRVTRTWAQVVRTFLVCFSKGNDGCCPLPKDTVVRLLLLPRLMHASSKWSVKIRADSKAIEALQVLAESLTGIFALLGSNLCLADTTVWRWFFSAFGKRSRIFNAVKKDHVHTHPELLSTIRSPKFKKYVAHIFSCNGCAACTMKNDSTQVKTERVFTFFFPEYPQLSSDFHRRNDSLSQLVNGVGARPSTKPLVLPERGPGLDRNGRPHPQSNGELWDSLVAIWAESGGAPVAEDAQNPDPEKSSASSGVEEVPALATFEEQARIAAAPPRRQPPRRQRNPRRAFPWEDPSAFAFDHGMAAAAVCSGEPSRAATPDRPVFVFGEKEDEAFPADRSLGVPCAENACKDLPIFARREEILASVRAAPFAVIEGETGCGKSSCVPQLLIDYGADSSASGGGGGAAVKVVVTQPRRIAAISLAKWVSKMRQVKLGSVVGYRIKDDVRDSPNTSLTYMTTGYLLKLLANKKEFMREVTHLVLDEMHERSLHQDLLCLLLRLRAEQGLQMKLVVMSATLDCEVFGSYFSIAIGCAVAKPISFRTRVSKLDVYHLEELEGVLEMRRSKHISRALELYSGPWMHQPPSIIDTMRHVFFQVLDGALSAHPHTCLLVFLPGMADIETVYDDLEGSADLEIVVLHSLVPDQSSVFDPIAPGKTRIVLATNIAETSITVPDVEAVIDAGMVREIEYDAHRGMVELGRTWASQSSAVQRAGRAGRLRDGVCYRLYPTSHFREMQEYSTPEMLRVSVENVVLQTKAVDNTHVRDNLSKAIAPPADGAVVDAFKTLHEMGATSGEQEDAAITFLGQLALSLPYDLAVARMIYYGVCMGCGIEAVLMASSISTDIYRIPSRYHNTADKYVEELVGAAAARSVADASRMSDPIAAVHAVWMLVGADGSDGGRGAGRLASRTLQRSVSFRRLRRLVGDAKSTCKRLQEFGLDSGDLQTFVKTSNVKQLDRAMVNRLRFLLGCSLFHNSVEVTANVSQLLRRKNRVLAGDKLRLTGCRVGEADAGRLLAGFCPPPATFVASARGDAACEVVVEYPFGAAEKEEQEEETGEGADMEAAGVGPSDDEPGGIPSRMPEAVARALAAGGRALMSLQGMRVNPQTGKAERGVWVPQDAEAFEREAGKQDARGQAPLGGRAAANVGTARPNLRRLDYTRRLRGIYHDCYALRGSPLAVAFPVEGAATPRRGVAASFLKMGKYGKVLRAEGLTLIPPLLWRACQCSMFEVSRMDVDGRGHVTCAFRWLETEDDRAIIDYGQAVASSDLKQTPLFEVEDDQDQAAISEAALRRCQAIRCELAALTTQHSQLRALAVARSVGLLLDELEEQPVLSGVQPSHTAWTRAAPGQDLEKAEEDAADSSSSGSSGFGVPCSSYSWDENERGWEQGVW